MLTKPFPHIELSEILVLLNMKDILHGEKEKGTNIFRKHKGISLIEELERHRHEILHLC